ncbi:hypothetical protein [Streptacidiphilus monticola]|uniref:DUF3618 domain-containing protein n=1 Tax=Streptacidiphilus monticola TaxID=2161674 RepID=A0ABW1G766_9ACTN
MNAKNENPAAAPVAGNGPAGAAQQAVLHPMDTLASAVQRIPGAGVVRGAADTVLDTVGLVSPRSRRWAAYAGAGVLGAVGVVEWPVAAAGAAGVWLSQGRRPTGAAQAPQDAPTPADVAHAAARSHHGQGGKPEPSS